MTISIYDAHGRYISTGSNTIIPQGVPMPPPYAGDTVLDFGAYMGPVNLDKQYHDMVSDSPVDIPKKPTELHIFDWASKQWIDPRVLADFKSAKNDEINAARLKANCTHFMFNGKQIATDALSRGDIDAVNGIVALTNEMPSEWFGGWKTTDNSYISIPDIETWTLFYKAMVTQGNINFARSQSLKAQLEEATTIEEVEAIVW